MQAEAARVLAAEHLAAIRERLAEAEADHYEAEARAEAARKVVTEGQTSQAQGLAGLTTSVALLAGQMEAQAAALASLTTAVHAQHTVGNGGNVSEEVDYGNTPIHPLPNSFDLTPIRVKDIHPTLMPSVGSGSRGPRLPLPEKFNGSGNVHDALFLIKNYLKGADVPVNKWAQHAVNLLSGKALEHWVTFAKPMEEHGGTPSWEDVVSVLTTMYGKQDLHTLARQEILHVQQGGSVQAYLGHIRTLLARAGPPQFHDPDLINIFLHGLRPDMANKCRLDPGSGKHWTSFTALTEYAIRMEGARHVTLPSYTASTPFREKRKVFDRTKYPVRSAFKKIASNTPFRRPAQGGGSSRADPGSYKRSRSDSREPRPRPAPSAPAPAPQAPPGVDQQLPATTRCGNCRSLGHGIAACPHPRGGPFPWSRRG